MNTRASWAGQALPGLALTFNALAWGLAWWPLRQMDRLGLHPLWTTADVFACACLVIVATQPRALSEVLRSPVMWTLLLASGATNTAFNWAVTIGDVVRVVLLFYLMPLWTVVLARWLLRERLTALTLLRVALALAGAAAVLAPASGSGWGWPLPRTLPDALGIAGGFFFALNNVLLRREAARSDASRAMAMFLGGAVIAGASAALLATANVVPWPGPLSGPVVAGVLALGSVFLFSNFALQYGAARLPANAAAVIMMSEVLFATLSSVWLDSTVLHPQILWGGGLILLAALLSLYPEPQSSA
ncbi:MAG: EamA family transporter [Pseudomonadota bacterium]